MRLIRFVIGMSLVAVSVLGSARAQSPAELSQVSGQEALTNRFEFPVSEMDRLSDRQAAQRLFFCSIARPIEVTRRARSLEPPARTAGIVTCAASSALRKQGGRRGLRVNGNHRLNGNLLAAATQPTRASQPQAKRPTRRM